MSQTKQWAANKGLATRRDVSDGSTQGAGDSTRLYVGKFSGKQYTSYVSFALNWTDVGKIVSAVLNIYTDDGLGTFPSTQTEHPKVTIRRLTESFSEGSGNSAFIAGDYDSAAATSSDQKTASVSRAESALNQIDITAMIEDVAPKTVKRRDGTAGGAATFHGLKLSGSDDTDENWAAFSEDYSNAAFRPFITLTYEYGVTVPDTPASLSPSGAVASLTVFAGSFSDPRSTDQLRFSQVQVYTSAATNAGQVVTGGTKVYDMSRPASNAEIVADAFAHDPDSLVIPANTTYKWRGRVQDQEGQWSLYTNLVSFSVTNTVPNAPTASPVSASSFASFDGVLFGGGTFSDPNVGDYLLAYQVQLSAYPEGDAHWLDDAFILWNTGKQYVPFGDTSWQTPYGGQNLTAGTYYWRARQWDNKQGVSAWTYASIVLTASFALVPGPATTLQLRPKAPWRIVIKNMLETDGVTRKAGRGPGSVVAILTDAKNVGASKLWNSPGEMHFTLPKDHPQISVIEPRQTHYSIQHRQGDGWRETYAGLVMDFDATDTDVVFTGTDYPGLLDYIADERYDASNPDVAAESGGSKYVTSGHNSISYIVDDQLDRAKALANSIVGFIDVGTVDTMSETVVVFSTYAQTLQFITSLLDSHRAGTGKRSRLSCRQKVGGYEWIVEENPGQVRENLKLRYGEFVNGYRVIPFGPEWASRVNSIGRAKDGVRVLYTTQTAPGIDEATWGHWAKNEFVDGVADENDLKRRSKQNAVRAGKLGKAVALGYRSQVLQPFDGYDICDHVPIDIEDGSVSTDAFGSGYWTIVGVTWEADAKTGKQTTTLSLDPREDTVAPDTDLLTLEPINTQAEWQIGWVPPTSDDTGRKFLDQSTGATYLRADAGTYVQVAFDPRQNNLLVNSGFEVNPIATTSTKVWTAAADWGTATNTTNLATGGTELGMTTATY